MFVRLIVCLTLSATLFVGCKDRKPAGASGGAETRKKILQVGNGAEPQGLDPQIIKGVPEHHLAIAFFEGLVTQNPDDAKDPLPGVAETWEVSPDGLTYTFHLRHNAQWSDGHALTAKDFLRSYQRMLSPKLAADYVYMFFSVKGAKEYFDGTQKDFAQVGFRATDDYTLTITLAKPAPFFLRSLVHEAWFPVPVHIVEKFAPFGEHNVEWTRPEHFVGNGPFRLKQWLPNQKIVAERSPTYWDREVVKLDEIHFYAVEFADTEDRMFRANQLHLTNEVPLSKIPLYQRESPELLRVEPWCGTYFYRFNIQRKPLDDLRVRRALSLAIDRESLVQNVVHIGTPAYALVPPNTAGYTSQYQLHTDVAEAKRLLAEAGFPEGRGFPKLDILYNNLEKHRTIAEVLQEMWRRNLGIEVGLLNEEWKVYMVDQNSINFAIARGGWLADYVDPHVFFDIWQTKSENNNTHWSNADYDRLLEAALDKNTNEERYAVYHRMEKILLDDLPILPLFYYERASLVSPKVKNYRITLLDTYPWKLVDMEP